MEYGGFVLALSLVNLVLLGAGVVITAFLWSEVRAMQNSTHRIEYRDPFKEVPEGMGNPTELTDDEREVLEEDPFDELNPLEIREITRPDDKRRVQ